MEPRPKRRSLHRRASTKIAVTEINWAFFVGQSLAVGASSIPKLSTDPYDSDWTSTFDSGGARVDLAMEVSGQQPVRTAAEVVNRAGRVAVWNTHAQGGSTYNQLKKGTAPYQAAITRATAAHGVAVSDGDAIAVQAIHIVHGESNSGSASRTTYAEYVAEWRSDFDTDLKAVTGQVTDVHAFVCQLRSTDPVGYGQFDAMVADPTRVHLVCPKYQLDQIDGLHLTAAGSWYLGEYHGRAHRTVIIDGSQWVPLCPRAITQTGARTVEIRFHVPTGPLVFRTDLISAQFQQGFRITDDSGVTNLASVTLTAADTVTLTHSRDINGVPVVSYGTGNLCDSDPYESTYDGRDLPNWGIKFTEAAGFSFELPAPTESETQSVDVNGDPVVRYARDIDGSPSPLMRLAI